MRLDHYLVGQLSDLTRSQIKHLIDDGHVTVNDKIVKAGTPIRSADKVEVNRPAPQPTHLVSEKIPLDILFEDSFLIAINKPPGMVVHPAPGHPSGTLVNALLAHVKDLRPIGGVHRPGLVHRLDKGTSGVVVIAKNEEAYRSLAKQFKDRAVEKIYLALVWGEVKKSNGTISSFLGRHPKQRQKIAELKGKGRWSVTDWKVKENFKDWTLLEIHPQTGRTHQIRVHLSEHNMPIVGDPLYGGRHTPGTKCPAAVLEMLKSFDHQALHAAQLSITHPRDGKRITLSAPWPADMKGLVDAIRAGRKNS